MTACPVEAKGTDAGRRYSRRTLILMTIYAALNIAAILGLFDVIPRWGAYVLALAVAAPIVGQLWVTLKLIEQSDEFVRALMVKRMILASGLAIAAASAWGFTESYADAPHLPGWLIYPLFWGFFGVVTPFVRSTR